MAEHIFGDRVIEQREGGGVTVYIVKMNAEQRERIVRCRDCSMYDAEDGMCLRDPEHTGRGWYANPDGFCAWSEPRKED